MKDKTTRCIASVSFRACALPWLLALATGTSVSAQVFVAVEVSYPGGGVSSSVGSSACRDLPLLRRTYDAPASGWSTSPSRFVAPRGQALGAIASAADTRRPLRRLYQAESPSSRSDAVVCYVSRPAAPAGDTPIASVHPPGPNGMNRGIHPRRQYANLPLASPTAAKSLHRIGADTRQRDLTPRRAQVPAMERLRILCDEDFRQLEQLLDANLPPDVSSELIGIVVFVLEADLMDLGEGDNDRSPDAAERGLAGGTTGRDADAMPEDSRAIPSRQAAPGAAASLPAQIARWREIAERLEAANASEAGNVLTQLDQLEQQFSDMVADEIAGN